MKLYGQLRPDLPPAEKLSLHRTRVVLHIVEEFPFSRSLDWWENHFDRDGKSSFLTGIRGWKTGLDWLLVPTNVQKVLGGMVTVAMKPAF